MILELTDIIETSSASSASQPVSVASTASEEESPNSKTLINMKPSSYEMNAVKKHESPHMKVKETNITLANGGENVIDSYSKAPGTTDEASLKQQKNSENSKEASTLNATSAVIGDSSPANLKQSTNNGSLSTSTENSKSLGAGDTNDDKTNSSGAAKKCAWDGKFISNHTLVGGINSGDFREHSKATTIEQCMDNCCREEDCDLSFMIDTDCYTVKCSKMDLCQTRKAKMTNFVPKIAYKRRSNVLVEDESKYKKENMEL